MNQNINSIYLPDVGQIQLIIGPMFSGKTEELLRRVKRFTIANKSCIVIKYSKDTRYSSDKLSTHDQRTIDAISMTRLFNLDETILQSVNVIAIDEGQFFVDLVEFSEQQASNGKILIIAALDGTYERKPFDNIAKLIPMTERIDKLTAICNCGNEASFSERLSFDNRLEVIGGKDKYKASCRACFNIPTGIISSTPTRNFNNVNKRSMPGSMPINDDDDNFGNPSTSSFHPTSATSQQTTFNSTSLPVSAVTSQPIAINKSKRLSNYVVINSK